LKEKQISSVQYWAHVLNKLLHNIKVQTWKELTPISINVQIFAKLCAKTIVGLFMDMGSGPGPMKVKEKIAFFVSESWKPGK
jgi:hypothetical protein